MLSAPDVGGVCDRAADTDRSAVALDVEDVCDLHHGLDGGEIWHVGACFSGFAHACLHGLHRVEVQVGHNLVWAVDTDIYLPPLTASWCGRRSRSVCSCSTPCRTTHPLSWDTSRLLSSWLRLLVLWAETNPSSEVRSSQTKTNQSPQTLKYPNAGPAVGPGRSRWSGG